MSDTQRPQQPDAQIPDSILPKSGFRTSSFAAALATIIVGGVFTYLVGKGLPQQSADAHRQIAIDLVAQLLPVAYLALIGVVTKAHIGARQVVSQAKADALVAVVKSRAGIPGPSAQVTIENADVAIDTGVQPAAE